MMEVCFLFPGQGSQKVGMCLDFIEGSGVAARLARSNPDVGRIVELIKSGPEEQLNRTSNAQPAIFLAEICAYEMVCKEGISPSLMIGHSLGEYAALACAGAASYDDLFTLVLQRGMIMEEANQELSGKMVAVLGREAERVERIVESISGVYVANYNSPEQVVIAGFSHAVEEAASRARELGLKTVPLAVGAASHTPLMEKAAQRFAAHLAKVRFCEPKIPVFSPSSLAFYNAQNIAKVLEKQLTTPVMFRQAIEMFLDPKRSFVEVGPGGVLTRLLSKSYAGYAFSSFSDRSHILEFKAKMAKGG